MLTDAAKLDKSCYRTDLVLKRSDRAELWRRCGPPRQTAQTWDLRSTEKVFQRHKSQLVKTEQYREGATVHSV
ncbi:hypothetical protein GN956_G17700 [Arapaima gigas]